MMGERNNFEKKANLINIDEVKKVLDERVGVETAPNLLHVVSQIGSSFNEALESEDKERIKELYEKIRMHDNYLSEKYRDTSEQREYNEAVEQSMEVLRNKIKAFKNIN